MASDKMIKSTFESMMFIWGEPLDVKTGAEVLNIDEKEALRCLLELQEEYEREDRGLRLRRVSNGFQFVTPEKNGEYIERLCRPVKRRKLTQSAMEVLAIVAYKQPVTRADVEAVRGVKCARVLEGLEDKNLIEEKGRSEGIGRPILYGTTDEFLKYFGFENISELPVIDGMDEVTEEYRDEIIRNQISIEDMREDEG